MVRQNPARQSLSVVELILPTLRRDQRIVPLVQFRRCRRNGILKAAVPDHLRIKSAVPRPVDILKKDAIQILTDRKFLLRGANPKYAPIVLQWMVLPCISFLFRCLVCGSHTAIPLCTDLTHRSVFVFHTSFPSYTDSSITVTAAASTVFSSEKSCLCRSFQVICSSLYSPFSYP